MKIRKSFLILISLPLIGGVVFGTYMLRWLSVLALSLITLAYLFGEELKISYPSVTRRQSVKRRDEVKRIAKIIEKAKKSPLSRSILKEQIIEIYMTLSDDQAKTYRGLHEKPNKALLLLEKEGDFLENLEKALKVVEVDINES
ncbi:MAG: hypothetical protein J7K48_00420 [Thermococcus sp.]|uniref:Uncharacterized protein n=1 Tax=Thermococcus guaymasensis DSM 11113 TaxID=1432656 RepID=A0A0X1KJY2_9EURY|nr:hypothetical protein [Thermococcus guaymasensis]AJC71584.1 hypothetical protein X802_04910 [Thermococcus guaymasensis DSM 11113]MCD6523457.1 hypothetical protein [Thermococcus sp.]